MKTVNWEGNLLFCYSSFGRLVTGNEANKKGLVTKAPLTLETGNKANKGLLILATGNVANKGPLMLVTGN